MPPRPHPISYQEPAPGSLFPAWDVIVTGWRERLEDFAVDLDALFTDVRILDPDNPVGRPFELSWWPKSQLRRLHIALQAYFDQWPGTNGSIHPNERYIRKGPIETLEYLWAVQGSPSLICALLVAASLFPRLHSSRRNHQYALEYWPPYRVVKELDTLARAQLTQSDTLEFHPWFDSCTEVLPLQNDDELYRLETSSALINYLAEEHAAALLSMRPIRVVFSDTRDPFIAEAIAANPPQGVRRI